MAGAGPGHTKYLTEEVKVAIKEAKHVIAFNRVAGSLISLRKDIKIVEKVEDIESLIKLNKSALILATGDPCFFGIVDYIKDKGIAIDKIMPGLSSFQYMMSKLQKSWHRAQFVSLHGRDGALEKVKNRHQSIILTDKNNPPSLISQKLRHLGLRGKIYIGYNLSYDDERIVEGEIGHCFADHSALAIMVIENEMD